MANSFIIISGDPLVEGGVPPVVVIGPAPTAGMVIAALDPLTAEWSDVSSGTVVMGGAVGGTAAATTINLTGNASISGALDAARLPTITMAGDVTGTTAAAVVVNIQGNQVLSGALGASQDGYVLTWHNASSQWQALPDVDAGGAITLTGDVTGSSSSNHVISITGGSGVVNVAATGNVITWAAATTAPGLAQVAATGTTGANLTITPQSGTVAGGNVTGGDLVVSLQEGTGTGTESGLSIQHNGVAQVRLAGAKGYSTYGNIWLGSTAASPTENNWTLQGGGTVTYGGGTTWIMPTTVASSDATSNLGSTSARWGSLFAMNVILGSTILNDVTATAVTTTNATLTTIYTSAMASSSMNDYVVSVWGLDHTNGDVYRADLAFTYQRIVSAGPTIVGAAAVPLNVRATTNGLTWGGASIAVSSNNILVQVKGIASINIDWKCSVSVATVT